MKTPFVRLAALGLTLLFGTAAFAQVAPPATPGVAVKGHVRHLKSGKTVMVHGYTRTKTAKPKMVAVKAYTRHLKSGKTVMVHATMRHAPKKK
jgi:acyl CoA:acetate/3-ketoacid CoA transferase alpha subunit